MDGLALEEDGADDGEDRKGNAFLDDFELHQAEGSPVDVGTQPVGRNHCRVLEKRYAPGGQYDKDQGPVVIDVHLRQLELAVPGYGHENVGHNQQKDGPQTL